MACIGGILLYVAINMVKPAEVKQVLAHNRFHVSLMVFTAVMVIVTDFLIGVLSAIVLLRRALQVPGHARRDGPPGRRAAGGGPLARGTATCGGGQVEGEYAAADFSACSGGRIISLLGPCHPRKFAPAPLQGAYGSGRVKRYSQTQHGRKRASDFRLTILD